MFYIHRCWRNEKRLHEQIRLISLGRLTNLILLFKEIPFCPDYSAMVFQGGLCDDRNAAKSSIPRKQSVKKTLSQLSQFRAKFTNSGKIVGLLVSDCHFLSSSSVNSLFLPNHLEAAATCFCHPLCQRRHAPLALWVPWGWSGKIMELQSWFLLMMDLLFRTTDTLETTLSVSTISRQ